MAFPGLISLVRGRKLYALGLSHRLQNGQTLRDPAGVAALLTPRLARAHPEGLGGGHDVPSFDAELVPGAARDISPANQAALLVQRPTLSLACLPKYVHQRTDVDHGFRTHVPGLQPIARHERPLLAISHHARSS